MFQTLEEEYVTNVLIDSVLDFSWKYSKFIINQRKYCSNTFSPHNVTLNNNNNTTTTTAAAATTTTTTLICTNLRC